MKIIDQKSFPMDSLDKRLVKALLKTGDSQLTEIQKHILSNKSPRIFLCSNSNKSLGYVMFVLNEYLKCQKIETEFSSLILVPTKDSAEQIYQLFLKSSKYCPQTLKIINLSKSTESSNELFNKSLLATHSDIIIATPGMLVHYLSDITFSSTGKFIIIIDELNMMMHLGYQHDLLKLGSSIQSIEYQCIICSDSVDQSLRDFSFQFLSHDPIYIEISDKQNDSHQSNISYSIHVNSIEDRYLVMFVLLKLKMLQGKLLIFSNNISNSYRLQVFLARFDIKTQVLNPNIPYESDAIKSLNQGKHNIIITVDEYSNESFKLEDLRIDSVINFDLNENHEERHRYCSAIIKKNSNGFIVNFAKSNELLNECKLQPFHIQMDKIEGFRYRVMDVLKSITRNSIRDAQLQDIKHSLLTSKKLTEHFANHPKDMDVLNSKNKKRKLTHVIKYVPEYCITKLKNNISQ